MTQKTLKIILRGTLPPIYSIVPVEREETAEGVKLYIKPRGYPRMRIRPSRFSPDEFADKREIYHCIEEIR